jgi:hypothetical protein
MRRKQIAEVLMTKKAFNEIQLTLNSNNNNNNYKRSSKNDRRDDYESHVKAEKRKNKKNKKKINEQNFSSPLRHKARKFQCHC